MMRKLGAPAAAALFMMMSAPCMAADDRLGWGPREQRAAAFAGANVRLPLGGKVRANPTARLQLTTIRSYQNGQSGNLTHSSSVVPRQHVGLELGLESGTKPELFVGGQSTSLVRERLQMAGLADPTLGTIFAVALVAVGVLVITSFPD